MSSGGGVEGLPGTIALGKTSIVASSGGFAHRRSLGGRPTGQSIELGWVARGVTLIFKYGYIGKVLRIWCNSSLDSTLNTE